LSLSVDDAKTWETESQSIAARIPGHHRPVITKQLKCQSLQCESDPCPVCPARLASFSLRHRRAADMPVGGPKTTPGAGQSPILRQFRALPGLPIKAAAPPRNNRHGERPSLATFAPAQALVMCPLPHTKQNQKCLQNIHSVTFFDHLASAEGTDDIEF
jgi:hypothetical protein